MSERTGALDAIELQLALGALHAACGEMGALLIRAAHSPNIKERRDASSALFDARGEMIMQAEHIPVHLGAMPAAVAAVIAREQAPGRSRILLDFAGSAAQHPGNLNCPLAVTHSACYFAVRVLTDPDTPPNAGAYRPLEARAPAGSLLNARAGAAVAAGNVETSSRIADLVLGAFGRALGQGTMNNLTLGNDGFSYYETSGGGQGACPDSDGPSGVHVAMSNTLNTPAEALERAYPLRVVRNELRRGSGGDGRFRGGDGLVREIEALEPMEFSLIAERRRHPPRGAAGGSDGACGRDTLDGRPLASKASGTLGPGSRIRIETPGGGGHGAAE